MRSSSYERPVDYSPKIDETAVVTNRSVSFGRSKIIANADCSNITINLADFMVDLYLAFIITAIYQLPDFDLYSRKNWLQGNREVQLVEAETYELRIANHKIANQVTNAFIYSNVINGYLIIVIRIAMVIGKGAVGTMVINGVTGVRFEEVMRMAAY